NPPCGRERKAHLRDGRERRHGRPKRLRLHAEVEPPTLRSAPSRTGRLRRLLQGKGGNGKRNVRLPHIPAGFGMLGKKRFTVRCLPNSASYCSSRKSLISGSISFSRDQSGVAPSGEIRTWRSMTSYLASTRPRNP